LGSLHPRQPLAGFGNHKGVRVNAFDVLACTELDTSRPAHEIEDRLPILKLVEHQMRAAFIFNEDAP